MRPIRSASIVFACLAMFNAPSIYAAQPAYPNRLVKIIVPFPAGGTADVLPRILADKLSAKWGQPVIVENRAGAGGNIGAETVAKADPDGYTLLASPPGPLAINQNLYKKLAFDPTKFVPITVMATVPNVLAVKSTLPVDSVKALIAHAKAKPGTVTFASQGNGSTSHLTAVMFESMAGVQMVHIPYKGTAPALTDLLGGQVDVFFDNLGSSLTYHQSGKLKILAVASPERVPSLKDVPTIAEVALPGFRSVTWFALVAPPGTPAPIAAQIQAAIKEALQLPDVHKRFLDQSAEPIGGSPAETASFIKDEVARWGKVIKSAKVTVD